uniref:Small ribosomal subunit protein mS33 n=1 Tax=Strongyloides venezuelensis TaxID=75913 RepID=A0A0K0EZU3_STRVS
MSGRTMASRIVRYGDRITNTTPYGKRMERLSNRIFNEVTTPTDDKSMKIVKMLAAEPLEQQDQKSVSYYPNLPMFHYLTKLLYFHGLFKDDHVIWRKLQDEIKINRGKVVRPVIGEGKRAQLRKK